jgi:hypothetical protein
MGSFSSLCPALEVYSILAVCLPLFEEEDFLDEKGRLITSMRVYH